MKDINYIFTQYKLFYSIVFILSLSVFLILNFIQNITLQWLSISFLLFLNMFITLYLLKRNSNKILEDTVELKRYIEDISKKEYNSILHIKYFQEYLEISVMLKNIVKRLNQKDKKSSKK